MVHYLLATDEQRELAEGARKILDKELAPRVADLDRKHEFPMDVLKKMAEAGYYNMGLSEEYGGLGLDFTTQAVIYEEMAQVDAGFSFSLSIASGIEAIATTAMSDETKAAFYAGGLSGDIICATALTEPGAGSDTKAIRTTAVREGNEWVLNGTKCFISNGGIANVFIISAYVDKSKGAKGIAQFFVEKERGVQVGKVEDKMGLNLSVTSEIILDNVRVPMDHMIGSLFFMQPEKGKALMAKYGGAGGNSAILDGIAIARVTTMFHAIGLAQAAIDAATKYSTERRTFGKRICDHQGLGFLLADMQMRLEACRGLAYYAVQCLDKGLPMGTLASSTKVFVSESVMQITLDAIQVLGGYGYMREYPVEKLARDAKIFSIFEGTNQICRMVAARQMVGRDPLAVKPNA